MEECKEIWKDIPGYEPYQVSNLGRVRNNKELKTNRDATKRGKPLKTRLNRNGYEELKIRKDGKQIHMLQISCLGLKIQKTNQKQIIQIQLEQIIV